MEITAVKTFELKEFIEEMRSLKTEFSEIKNANKHSRIFTSKEACEFLQVNKATLWRWVQQGIIVAHKIGGATRYFEWELIEALKQKKGLK